MTDAVGVITGFYFYLKKNGAGWHADSITTGYLFVNIFFACLGDWNELHDLFSTKY